MTVLSTGATANGNTDTMDWGGGIGNYICTGTFDTSTCALQMSPDQGTTWVAVGSFTTLTAVGIGNFQLSACQLRANVSSVGAGTDVRIEVR